MSPVIKADGKWSSGPENHSVPLAGRVHLTTTAGFGVGGKLGSIPTDEGLVSPPIFRPMPSTRCAAPARNLSSWCSRSRETASTRSTTTSTNSASPSSAWVSRRSGRAACCGSAARETCAVMGQARACGSIPPRAGKPQTVADGRENSKRSFLGRSERPQTFPLRSRLNPASGCVAAVGNC